MRIEVKRQVDSLNQHQWVFWVDKATIYLDSFRTLTRETTRHKLKVTGPRYDRIDQRYSTLQVSEVPLPDDVAADAKAQFCAKVTVEKWRR